MSPINTLRFPIWNATTSKELDIRRESAASGTNHKAALDNPLSLDHFRQVTTDI